MWYSPLFEFLDISSHKVMLLEHLSFVVGPMQFQLSSIDVSEFYSCSSTKRCCYNCRFLGLVGTHVDSPTSFVIATKI